MHLEINDLFLSTRAVLFKDPPPPIYIKFHEDILNDF